MLNLMIANEIVAIECSMEMGKKKNKRTKEKGFMVQEEVKLFPSRGQCKKNFIENFLQNWNRFIYGGFKKRKRFPSQTPLFSSLHL